GRSFPRTVHQSLDPGSHIGQIARDPTRRGGRHHPPDLTGCRADQRAPTSRRLAAHLTRGSARRRPKAAAVRVERRPWPTREEAESKQMARLLITPVLAGRSTQSASGGREGARCEAPPAGREAWSFYVERAAGGRQRSSWALIAPLTAGAGGGRP